MTHLRDDSTWQWQHLLDDTCPTASTALTADTSVHFTMSLRMTFTGTELDRHHMGNWFEDCFCWSQTETDRLSMTSYSVLTCMGEYLVGFSTIQNWTLVQDYTNSLHSGSRLRMCLSGTHLACRLHLSTFFVVDYHYSASESQHCSATWHLRAIGCTSLKLPSSIWFPPDDQHHTTQCLQKPPCFWQRLHSTTTIKLYSLQPATDLTFLNTNTTWLQPHPKLRLTHSYTNTTQQLSFTW